MRRILTVFRTAQDKLMEIEFNVAIQHNICYPLALEFPLNYPLRQIHQFANSLNLDEIAPITQKKLPRTSNAFPPLSNSRPHTTHPKSTSLTSIHIKFYFILLFNNYFLLQYSIIVFVIYNKRRVKKKKVSKTLNKNFE